ncbi:uncharacterized protein LOC121384484 [Gigantopelta aegis]|uniref:uncharacterized protein LOC121384484 n=1 Tax=Gigantopelta aegis TaxID=1735272 RepID=UPI001B88B41C|nr:uncharacterized protein LOC121384484 [Gigantopelta aegis]
MRISADLIIYKVIHLMSEMDQDDGIQLPAIDHSMVGVDFGQLDAQIESLAGDDLDSLLEELKGFHDMTDGDSESPEIGGPVLRGTEFSRNAKLSKYETVIKKLEAIHGVTPSDESDETQAGYERDTGLDMLKKQDGPNVVELTRRAKYLKDKLHKAMNYCANKPCKNGGKCIPGKTGYRCQCPTGYQGTHCETRQVFRRCVEIRNKYPQAEDGEYWMYPEAFHGKKVQIYCHFMKTRPREYVTLRVINRGNSPRMSFKNCKLHIIRLEDDNSHRGSIFFTKIGVYMAVHGQIYN